MVNTLSISSRPLDKTWQGREEMNIFVITKCLSQTGILGWQNFFICSTKVLIAWRWELIFAILTLITVMWKRLSLENLIEKKFIDRVNRGSIVWLLVMDAASRIKLWSKQLKTAEIRRFERPQLVETWLKVPTFDCEKEESKDLLKIVLSPKDWKVLS